MKVINLHKDGHPVASPPYKESGVLPETYCFEVPQFRDSLGTNLESPVWENSVNLYRFIEGQPVLSMEAWENKFRPITRSMSEVIGDHMNHVEKQIEECGYTLKEVR